MSNKITPFKIALVGPCSSGKSTLQTRLKALGLDIRHIAQEHSYVKDMWQRRTNPDILIFLDIDYANTKRRRPHTMGGSNRLAQQHHRLRHAREHCDFYLDTSQLTPDDVYAAVVEFLRSIGGLSLTTPEETA